MKMSLAEVITHQRKHGFIEAEKVLTLPLLVESLDRIDFFMDFCPPTNTAQQKGASIITPKGGGKPFIHWFTKKETIEAEKAIAGHLAPFIPKRPFLGPLRLVTEWTFPWRTAEPKRNRVDGWMWKDTASDADNLTKTMMDVLQSSRFYDNDSQICDLRVTKQWGDRPGIRITLEALTPQAPIPPAEKKVEPTDPSPF